MPPLHVECQAVLGEELISHLYGRLDEAAVVIAQVDYEARGPLLP